MGMEFNAKKTGVDIFKTGGVVLTDRQTDANVHALLRGRVGELAPFLQV
jgi:hypothetical protein